MVLLAIFIAATLGWTGLSLYLSFRQITHVRRHRDAVPADFADSVSLEDHRKAADYTVAREKLAMVGHAVEAATSLAWVLGGIGVLYGALRSAAAPSLALGVAFFLATAAIQAIIGLPFDLYRAFVIEQRFGFNRTDLRTFAADRLKGWAIGMAVMVPLLAAALWAMRSFAGLWWLWAWIAVVGLMLAAPAVYVRLVAPRFNRFTPLGDTALRGRIEALLDRSGFRLSGLFTMDASRRTAHGNAYFIGFGRNKRIVLFDTLLARSTPEEVEAVVAHELGHFRHRHILFGLLRGALIALLGLAAFGWLCRQDWLLPSFGLAESADALRLFVCLLLASVVGPLLSLPSNWLSRRHEFQADDYARRAVSAGPMIRALTGLARDNASTLTPDPLYALANYSHPPVPLRVRHLRAGEAGA